MVSKRSIVRMSKAAATWTVAVIATGFLLAALPALAGTTARVSVATGGAQANGATTTCSVSADGRYVAFCSYASNLVVGDTAGYPDVFVRDRTTGATTRVNVATSGTEANAYSYECSISADGRYVAFLSSASNLVTGDTNGEDDVFVHDRLASATTRVNLGAGGTQANDSSYAPRISAGGRFVVFESYASILVAGDTNDRSDVFAYDRTLGTMTRASVASDGSQGDGASSYASISQDGRYVAFMSAASNLVAGDTNDDYDVFIHDYSTGATTRASVAPDGGNGDSDSRFPCLSSDGRCVAFSSYAGNLVAADDNGYEDVFVRDLVGGTTTRVSVATGGAQANWDSRYPALSADGRYVSFSSDASNLIATDTNGKDDVFTRDRVAGTTARVSVATDGSEANDQSGEASASSISGDGRYVIFQSSATNLVAADTNGCGDVFIHEGGAPAPTITVYGPKSTTIGPAANINITFSVDMLRPTAQGAMLINGVKAATFGGVFTWTGRKMTFNPTNNLLSGTDYKIVIGKAARSRAGVNMAKGFTWTFTTKPASAAAVTVTAAPTATGVQFTLSLASAAEVTVSIRNLAGREVATLTPGRLEAGVQSLLWNGKSKTGTQVPSGTYLLQVSANTADGSSAQALTSLPIR